MARLGRYEIIHPIGEGASSDVFLAFDPFFERHVALKRFHAESLRDPVLARAQRQQLQMEAALAGRLRHPHIVQIHDVTLAPDGAYLAMEYVAGGTLEAFCQPDTLLSVERVVEILFKCSRALEYAWRQGVTHRDIKPANILLTAAPDGEVKLSDFGSALFQDFERTIVAGIGSPAYMSPEQVREAPLTHQTDIYSLGVVMYQLLTGRLPYVANNHLSLAYQITRGEASPPSSLRPELPAALDDIVARAMHPDLTVRYAGWQEFSHDLAQFARTQRLAAVHTLPPESQRFQIMRAMPFFAHFDDVHIWEALRLSTWREVSAGSLIMREHDSGGSFALLASGRASIGSHGQPLHTLTAGECFGEMSLFGAGHVRSADVIADSDCLLIDVRGAALDQASADCRMRVYRAFLDTLARRLAAANQRIIHL
ncbi:MAG: protein kinase [Rhodocyclaceae bacterium]